MWLIRLLAVLLGLLGPLIVLEVSLRLFGPILPGNYDTGAYLVRHPTLGHFHVPNFSGWIKSREFTTHVRISPLGLRDRRSDYVKPPETLRILLLGDSFASAVQVQAHETLAARLEQALSQDAGKPFEVINAGVAAYGTGQEYLLLDQEGVRYQPDLVLLLFFVGNDVANNNYRLELPDGNLRLALKPYFDLERDGSLRFIEGPPPAPSTALTQRLRDCCVLFNVVETGVMNKLNRDYPREELEAVGGLRTPVRDLYNTRPGDEWVRAWRISELLLARVRDRAAEVGARLTIVGIPEWRTLDPVEWRRVLAGTRLADSRLDAAYPTNQLETISQRLGVHYVDLLPPLRQASAGSSVPLYYDFDKHWTAAGHAVAAQAVEQALRQWGLTGS